MTSASYESNCERDIDNVDLVLEGCIMPLYAYPKDSRGFYVLPSSLTR
jgi:hypothetical protein